MVMEYRGLTTNALLTKYAAKLTYQIYVLLLLNQILLQMRKRGK